VYKSKLPGYSLEKTSTTDNSKTKTDQWSVIILEKVIIPQIFEKSHNVYGILRVMVVFITDRLLYFAQQIYSFGYNIFVFGAWTGDQSDVV
jgi:hypothetical protein